METRPTPDRLRETLFNVLARRVAGASFIDAYAGTGAVGIEALSRGASHCTFIEKNRAAVEVIRGNLLALGLENKAEVYNGKAAWILERVRADIVFLDPPYALQRGYTASLDLLGGKENGLVVVQHASRFNLAEEFGRLRRQRVIKQGDNSLSFYELA